MSKSAVPCEEKHGTMDDGTIKIQKQRLMYLFRTKFYFFSEKTLDFFLIYGIIKVPR